MCLMKELVTTQSLFSTSFVHISHLDTSWDHLRRALKKTKPMLFYYPQVNPLLAHYIYRTYLQKKNPVQKKTGNRFSTTGSDDMSFALGIHRWHLCSKFPAIRHAVNAKWHFRMRSICINFFLLLPACSDKEKSPLEALSSHLFWVVRKWYSYENHIRRVNTKRHPVCVLAKAKMWTVTVCFFAKKHLEPEEAKPNYKSHFRLTQKLLHRQLPIVP